MIDRFIEQFTGWMIYSMGKRAYKRGDYHDYMHALAALKAGNCDPTCPFHAYSEEEIIDE